MPKTATFAPKAEVVEILQGQLAQSDQRSVFGKCLPLSLAGLHPIEEGQPAQHEIVNFGKLLVIET